MLPQVGVPEMLVIGIIALIVVGPKDLPILMRKVGRFVAHMRGMAAEFRASFDELRKEVETMRAAAAQPMQAAMQSAGLGDIKSEIELGMFNPHETPQPHVGPLGESLEPAPAAVEAGPAPEPEAEPKAKPKPRRKAKARTAAESGEPPPETGP